MGLKDTRNKNRKHIGMFGYFKNIRLFLKKVIFKIYAHFLSG